MQNKNEYKDKVISLWGCDDATHIVMALNEDQIELLEAISYKTGSASKYSCMPFLTISNPSDGHQEYHYPYFVNKPK